MFSDDMTLGEARDKLRELVDEGHKCPCCTQMAKVYRRKAHATMARSLILMYRAGRREWVHVPTVAGDACEVGKLRYWGLVEEETEVRREDGGRAGYWRVTPTGEKWLRNEVALPKYARIYDGRCLGFVGDDVTIVDALGTKFNYHELMAGI